MIRYFSYSVDNQCQASVKYLENLQRLFLQDEDSGMIQVEYSPGSQVILLYRLGELTRTYHLENDRSIPILASRLNALLVGESLDIRNLSLPLHAVRAMIQVLDCHPLHALQPIAQSLDQYFSTLKQDHFKGLLHIRLPDLDGFQVWVDGAPLSSQTVYSTSRGFVDSLPNLQSPRTNGDKPTAQVGVYQPDPHTLLWELVGLSIAVGKLLSGTIAGYQKLVGHSMINALDYDLNTAMRMFNYNIRVVGDEMVDHDLFMDGATAQATYTGLLDCLLQHVTRVVGDQLAQRAFSEAHQVLDQADQVVLNKNSLTPAAIIKLQKETLG